MSEQMLPPLEVQITLMQRHQWIKRRNDPRYQCGPATSGRLLPGDAAAADKGQQAWVQNLSASGAGLILGQPLEPETCLTLMLRDGNGKSYRLPARVVHCTPQLAGEYLVGCEFAQRLTPDDLDALL